MRLPWKREISLVPSRSVSTKQQLELETAKEILAEVFHARPTDVEEMIQRKLEGRAWREEGENGLWPAEFCLGE
jgi:hypothetical protein